jgi:hypothetical protein
LFKNERLKLTPFAIALLVSIARGQKNSRLEENIFDYLKQVIFASFQNGVNNEDDLWWLQSILLRFSLFTLLHLFIDSPSLIYLIF